MSRDFAGRVFQAAAPPSSASSFSRHPSKASVLNLEALDNSAGLPAGPFSSKRYAQLSCYLCRLYAPHIRVCCPAWTTLSDGPQSGPASTRPSPSRREPRDSTGGRALLPPDGPTLAVTGALFLETASRRSLLWTLPPLQVTHSLPCVPPRAEANSPANSRYTAAAAAKINAQLQAKKGIQHVDVPPIRSSASTGDTGASSPGGAPNLNGEMYIADGDYIKDIEVNDLRNRYILTKGSTQHMVNIPLLSH